jgi:CheY-like chemotaxis protein
MTLKHQIYDPTKYYFTDTSFKLLMSKRVNNVLIIGSTYDTLIIEQDGRIDEQIFNEYAALNMRYPPEFIWSSTAEKAFEILNTQPIDLIITMLSVRDMDPFKLSKEIKLKYPEKHIVVLTPFSREITSKLNQDILSAIDYVFCWLGNADIILAIIKLIEDKMNVEYDVTEIGIQAIILVEDSIRFYSSFLPHIYKLIFLQSKEYARESLNEHQEMLRMRGRPKILLATNYNEAITLYEKYKNNLLGVISDVNYKRNNETDPLAGIRLCKKIKTDNAFIPFILLSSDSSYIKSAKELNAGFINKNSKTLSIELRNYIMEHFSFGDFIVRDPKNNKEIMRISDLRALQQKLFEIPDDSFYYHVNHNHFSRWLYARSLFSIADLFKTLRIEDFNNDIDEIRRYIFDAIANFRYSKGRGIIAEFNKDRFDKYLTFSRIGNGSIGGKARGLAFIDSMVKRNRLYDKWDTVFVTIPRTVVLTTDVFDEFMEENKLYKVGLSDMPDEKILENFIHSRLPFRIHADLISFITVIKSPIAIRSSSLLEDSQYQPFAGIYKTYMIPNNNADINITLEQLSYAIKCVYASTYFKASKAYMAATSNIIDEEKMGIVLQEVCGTKYNDRFYPTISGVARSINFYPIPPEETEDGVVSMALGLGKYIVDGGVGLNFSPKYPKNILQLSSPDIALKDTQNIFYALDLNNDSFKPSVDDGINLMHLKINEAEADNTLTHITSTYDYENNILREGTDLKGKKILTFSNILRHNVFPLADILYNVLKIAESEMNNPIEIEFAVKINIHCKQTSIFNLLQIRPIVDNKETINIDIDNIPDDKTIISSSSTLGNGIIDNIYDFIYVKPDTFKSANNQMLAMKISSINEQFIKEHKNYIIVAPGRWGSSDPALGIPVKWSNISAARVLVESGLDNYRIDPSQGTHFFHNITNFRVGYFTINPFINDGYYDLEYLSAHKAYFEDEHIRHIRFSKSIRIIIDGKKNKGVILKNNE